MTIDQIVAKLKEESMKSNICQKHACLAIRGNKLISPPFHNYMRARIYNFKCGSAHAEMATLNYLLGELWGEKWEKKQRCFLQLLHKVSLDKNDKKIMKKVRRKFSQISMVVIKSSSTHKLGSSRPCNMCLHAMKIMHIKYIYYSNANGEIVKEKIKYMKSTHSSAYQKHSHREMF
jgi:hypothetical protein